MPKSLFHNPHIPVETHTGTESKTHEKHTGKMDLSITIKQIKSLEV